MKFLNKIKAAAVAAAASALASPAFAGAAGADPFSPKISVISGWLTGPVGGMVIVMGIAILGYTLLTSEHGTPFKSALKLVGAGAVVVGAATIASSVFGTGALI